MSGHTPGAWRASPDPLVSCVVTGEGTDVTVVAECGERDVQLLAAAPRLAGALAALVRVNEEHNEAIAAIIGKPLDWKDAYLDDARAALREAGAEP